MWLQERCAAGISLRSIAAEVGCSRSAVQQATDRLGVVGGGRRRTPCSEHATWLEAAYIQRRLTVEGIAREIGTGAYPRSRGRWPAPGSRNPTAAAPPRLGDAVWLREMYVEEGPSGPQIAAMLSVSDTTVYQALARAGVDRRRHGVRPSPWLSDERWLHEQYVVCGKPVAAIAAEVGRSVSAVYVALRRHRVRRQTTAPRRPTDDRLIADWELRRSVTALAGRYGASRARTEFWLAEAGIFVRPRPHAATRATAGRIGAW